MIFKNNFFLFKGKKPQNENLFGIKDIYMYIYRHTSVLMIFLKHHLLVMLIFFCSLFSVLLTSV